MRPDPKAVSMLAVIEIASPSPSITERWVVPGSSSCKSGASRRPSRQGGVPGSALPGEAWAPLISRARAIR